MKNKKILLLTPRTVNYLPPIGVRKDVFDSHKEYTSSINSHVAARLSKESSEYNAFSGSIASSYGLLMISTLLKREGYHVRYLSGDYFKSNEDYYSFLKKYGKDYDAACISSTTPQFSEAEKINEVLKENNKKIKTMIGGPHTYYYADKEPDSRFDVVFIGYGLDKVPSIIDELLENEKMEPKIVKADYYYGCKKDFDAIPKEYLDKTILYSYLSFGCPGNCKYCIEGKLVSKVHVNMIDETLDEIETLVKRFGRRYIHMADSNFLLCRDVMNKFLDAFTARKIDCTFSINTSPQSLNIKENQDYIKRFIEQGLIEVLVGVEHFSKDVQLKISKIYNVENTIDSFEKIKKELKLPILGLYSLIGLPGETSSAIEDNINTFIRLKENKLYDFSFPKFFVPYPGTTFYKDAPKYNIKLKEMPWAEYHRWTYPRPLTIGGVNEKEVFEELKVLSKL